MGRRQSSIYRRKNLCTKQQKDQGGNFERKSQLSRCEISRTIQDARITQEDLLVARTKERYQEIHPEML